jgi:hypothetical protein
MKIEFNNAENEASNKTIVMMRNFMKTSRHIVNIDGGRTAYINGYFEFRSYFKKSKSTYYRWIKELEKIDEDFWFDRRVSGLLFYYVS